MKRSVASVAVVGLFASSAVAFQADEWTTAFTLTSGSPSLASSPPLGPADILGPGFLRPTPPALGTGIESRALIARTDLGLPGGAVIDAISSGRDHCGPGLVLFFYSVTAGSAGMPASVVNREVTGNGAAGDAFALIGFGGCPTLRSPTLEQDATDIQIKANPGQDDLEGLDVHLVYDRTDRPIYFSVSNASAGFLGAAPAGEPAYGGADVFRSEGKGTWQRVWTRAQLGIAVGEDLDALAVEGSLVWYSLRKTPFVPLATNGSTIFLVSNPGPSPSTSVFKDPDDLGLLPTDDVDAISILDPSAFFAPAHAFIDLDFDDCHDDFCDEDDPVTGLGAGTLWHPESACDGYSVQAPGVPPPFSSIAANPASIVRIASGQDDTITAPIPIPFPFSFLGEPKSTFQVSANGFVAFDQNLPSPSEWENDPIETPDPPNDMVAPWWDDLYVTTTGAVRTLYTAAGEVVVEWTNVERFPGNSSGESATFQAILNPAGEPANSVEFRYNYTAFVSGPESFNATLGIENWTGEGGEEVPGFPGNSNFWLPFGSSAETTFEPILPALPAVFAGGTAAFNEGNSFDWDYANGNPVQGGLRTPFFAFPRYTRNVAFSFDHARDTDFWTTVSVQARAASFSLATNPWNPVFADAQVPNTGPCGLSGSLATTAALDLDLDALKAQGGRLRFRFDATNPGSPGYRGWYVDNVRVTGGPVAFVQQYGQGCTNGASAPVVFVTGNPSLTGTFLLVQRVGGAPGASTLMVGFSGDSWLTFTLPIDVATVIPGLGTPGCLLEVRPDQFVFSAGGVVGLPVPPLPGPLDAFVQWFSGSPGGTFEMSDAAVIAFR